MANLFDKFDSLIASELREGESILWKGRPTGVKLMEAPYGTPIIIRWVVCLMLTACALWYGLVYAPSTGTIDGTSVTVVCLLIVIFFAIRPIMDLGSVRRKCVYCITNQRAIVGVMGTSLKIKSKDFAEAGEASLDMISDDRGNVYIGARLSNSFRKSRGDSLTLPTNPDDPEYKKRPLIFYSVAHPEEVLKQLPMSQQP